MPVVYRDCPFLFRFQLSIRIAVIMEKVLDLILFIFSMVFKVLIGILSPFTVKRSCPWSSQMALLQSLAVSLSMIALQIVKLVSVR